MKKFLVVTAVMLSVAGYAFAGDVRGTPSGDNSNPIAADYGGVDVYVASFTAAVAVSSGVTDKGGLAYFRAVDFSTVTPNTEPSTIYGVNFTSGPCNEFVDIYASTGGFVDSRLIERIYNVNGSTVGVTGVGGGTCGGFNGWRFPIRTYGNVFLKASSAVFNALSLHYWKEP